MILMGYAAVMVNIALLGVSGAVHNLFPDLSPTELIILLIAIEVSFFQLNSEICHLDLLVILSSGNSQGNTFVTTQVRMYHNKCT